MQVLQIKSSLNSTRAADLLFTAHEMINAVCCSFIIPVFHLWDRQKAVYLQEKVEDFNGNARLFLHIFYRHFCIKTSCRCCDRCETPLHWQNKKFLLFAKTVAARVWIRVSFTRSAQVCNSLSLSRARALSLSLSLSSCVFMFNSLMSWQNSSPLGIKGSMWSNAPLESSDI